MKYYEIPAIFYHRGCFSYKKSTGDIILISLTSILFFICSGIRSLEGPLERCLGSSGGGGEKCPGIGGAGILLSGES